MNIANKDGYRWGEKAYLIGHEFGLICVVYANCAQDALDYAVDEGFMASERMSDEDWLEHDSNGWHDSFITAGNAGEAFWCDYVWIKPASERKGKAQ